MIPFEISALNLVLTYWRDDIPVAAVVAACVVLYGIINLFAVRAYGETEFWLWVYCRPYCTHVADMRQGIWENCSHLHAFRLYFYHNGMLLHFPAHMVSLLTQSGRWKSQT